ncbi:MAG: cysteine--tRNA ligase, partial [Acidobacteria bacterium]|nr:cysteine--tRNA ligase [Acidobacteriota bacterium]
AEALAAIFDLVRETNTAMDRGEFHDGDRAPMREALEHWDRIFAVLEDTDREKLLKFGFITTVGRSLTTTWDIAPPDSVIGNASASSTLAEGLSDAEIEKRIAERDAARARRDFAGSDKIRDELLQAGVILEDTKAGTRWKRK